MECPSEEALLELIAGSSPADAPALRAHVESCAACGELLGILAGGSDEKGLATPPGATPTIDTLAPTLAPGAHIGRYVVLHRLGSGGMGVVYAGFDPELQRKVAIKLLRPESVAALGAEGNARILREAQSLARLAHPNIVAVFDVGIADEQVYVAMEYIEGPTVVAWLQTGKRTRSEILQIFLQAGEGLATAHEAGIAHRDFKPDNVLVGADGRVRVIDFGLSRIPSSAPVAGETRDALPSSLTRTGAVLGTPAYMAPEQFAGQPADARADQFSFCVSLYEALCGKRPFAGKTIDELRLAVETGAPAAIPRSARVPGWIERALARGLSVAPGDRFETLRELLRLLARDRMRVMKRVVVPLVILALGAAGLFTLQVSRDRVCRGSERYLAGLWPDQKPAVRRAILATQLPFAASAADSIERDFDRYAADWIAMRTQACEATALRHEQSSELLDARMSCLDRRLAEFKTQVSLLAKADAALVEHAATAAANLSSIDDCAALDKLSARVPLPRDPAVRRQIAEQFERVSQAKALDDAFRFDEERTLAEPTAAAAKKIGYRPLEAESLYRLGALQGFRGDLAEGRKTLHAAELAATAAGDDSTLLWVRLSLLRSLRGTPEAIGPEADSLSQSVLALLERDHDSEGPAMYMVALHELERSHPDKALVLLQRALAFEKRRQPRDGRSEGKTLTAIAGALGDLGKSDEAVAADRLALEVFEQTLGAGHPQSAATLINLGMLLAEQGHTEEAVQFEKRALAIHEKIQPPQQHSLASISNNLGMALFKLGQRDEAEAAYRRAIAIFDKLPDGALGSADALSNLAVLHKTMGQDELAISEHRRALALRERVLGPESIDVGISLNNLGEALEHAGRRSEALVPLAHALQIFEHALGPDHPYTGAALTVTGAAQLGLRRFRQAVASLERGLAIEEKASGDPADLAETRLLLARALWGESGHSVRARLIALQAREFYAREPAPVPDAKESLHAIDTLLAAHRPD